ncbi:MAG: glycerophosphodiester phosphodiesterase [Dehalococcoidia bacterium]
MDVHGSRDGVLVLMHDDTVDRTTDGTGRIKDLMLAEIKELDAGYAWTPDGGQRFPYRGEGIKMVTLEEVFMRFPDMPMNIEIKQRDPSIVASLCKLIRDHGRADQILIVSTLPEAMGEFRRDCAEVATSALDNEVRSFYKFKLFFLGRLYHPPAEAMQVPEYKGDTLVVTRWFVDVAHGRNMVLHVWTVNDVEDMRRMLDSGVDGIITDYPDRLLTLLGR